MFTEYPMFIKCEQQSNGNKLLYLPKNSYCVSIKFMKYLKVITLTLLVMLLITFKTVVFIDSCNSAGRCRVYFDNGTTDLLLNPFVGQKVYISQ